MATMQVPRTAPNSDSPATARRGSWTGAGFALTVVGWGANQFTPLVLMYRDRLALTPSVSMAAFGLYAAGLIPGLLIAGPLSDHVGRRRIVLFAVATSMVAATILAFGSHGIGVLFIGRVLMGVASGTAFSAGSAWVKELSSLPHEDAPAGTGARRAGIAMTLGFGIGPLVAGLLAQWGPAPTVLPYLPQIALAAIGLVLAARTPETVVRDTHGHGPLLRLHGFGDPRFVKVVLPLAPWVFGGASIAMVYVPGLTASHISRAAIAFAAVACMITAISGVLIQPVARRLDRGSDASRPRLLVLGLSLMIAGLAADAGVASLGGLGGGQAVLGLLTAVILGCGYGICMVFGLAEVQRLAPARDLAGMTAMFQAFTYLGFAVPYLLATLKSTASPTVLLLGLAGLAALTLAYTVRHAARTAARD